MKVITVIRENLFSVAARELNDALQWVNIARVNGITDPFIDGPQQLIIPTASSIFADGIGPQ